MGKGALEVFKFAVYVTLPFGALWVATDPHKMKRLLETTRYVVYPPEGPRPPTGSLEDVRAHEAARKAERAERAAAAAARARAEERAAAPAPEERPARPAASYADMIGRVLGWEPQPPAPAAAPPKA